VLVDKINEVYAEKDKYITAMETGGVKDSISMIADMLDEYCK